MNETKHKVYIGDAATILMEYPEGFFQLMITSPPYWNVRDYGHDGQIIMLTIGTIVPPTGL